MRAKSKWMMPEWMKLYEALITNTGGNPIRELMRDDGTNSNVQNNAPRALICVAVKSQVALLESLHREGWLLRPAVPSSVAQVCFKKSAQLLREEAEIIRRSNVDAKGRWVNADTEQRRHDTMIENATLLERLVRK